MLKKINLCMLTLGILTSTSVLSEDLASSSETKIVDTSLEMDNLKDQKDAKKEKTLEENDKKLTATQRTRIKLDEKRRLRKIGSRRSQPNLNDLDISDYFIKNLKYPDLSKGMLRESLYYIKLMKNSSNDEVLLKKESKNILWNIICLSNNLSKENYSVTFTMLVEQNIKTDEDKSNFEKSNRVVFGEISNMEEITKEEIILRCLEVYGKNK